MPKELNLKNVNEWLDKRLEEMAQFVFTRSQENIVAAETSDTGILLKSGYVRKTTKNIMEIGYLAPYAGYVEYGTRPHPMDPHRLVGWVKRKLGVTEAEALNVAYAIATKIRMKGTVPQPFFRPALHETLKKYRMKGIFSVRLEH